MDESYFKGRGAQIKTENKFLKAQYVTDHIEGLDEPLLETPATQIFIEHPKKIINKVDSPDLGMMYWERRNKIKCVEAAFSFF